MIWDSSILWASRKLLWRPCICNVLWEGGHQPALSFFFCLSVPDRRTGGKKGLRHSLFCVFILLNTGDWLSRALMVIAVLLVAVLGVIGKRVQRMRFPPTICSQSNVSVSAPVSRGPFREAHSLIIICRNASLCCMRLLLLFHARCTHSYPRRMQRRSSLVCTQRAKISRAHTGIVNRLT